MMKVRLIDAREVFKDSNNGYLYGIEQENEGNCDYIEWFKTKKARDNTIKKYKMKIIN